MGAIYRAVRADQQFEKQVAIKVIKQELATEQFLQRFRSERQTLCKLSARFLLFTIEVICEPLVDMSGFPSARAE